MTRDQAYVQEQAVIRKFRSQVEDLAKTMNTAKALGLDCNFSINQVTEDSGTPKAITSFKVTGLKVTKDVTAVAYEGKSP